MATENKDLWVAALNSLSAEDRKIVAFEGQDKLSVLSDLETLTKTAQDSSVKNRWRLRRPGHGGEDEYVVLRDLFGKIVVWIDRFKEIGDIVVQYDPAHAALPWAGVRFLLQIATSDFNKFNFVVEGAETIARSISRFAIFEDLYLHRTSLASQPLSALREAVVRLYAVIIRYLAEAKRYFQQSTAKRALSTLVKPQDKFEDIMRKITTEQSNVDRYASHMDAQNRNDMSDSIQTLSLDHSKRHTELLKLLGSIDGPIRRMTNQLEIIEDRLNASERINILSWLSSQPYPKHHDQVKGQALKDSGQWLLQDPIYAEWHKESVSSLLWLHGKPGSGKSTLVSIVIEDAFQRFQHGRSPPPVYFYCSRSAAEPERSNPDAVVASILRQLSCAQPGMSLLPSLVDKYKKQGEGFKSSGLPLGQSLELIIQLSEVYGMTTIIVDALDECDLESRQSLLDAFTDVMKESAGLVKIFVSSRDDQDIVCTLREYPSMEISSDRNTADIESFVKTETERLVQKRKLLRNSRAKAEMQTLIIDQVIGGADGMFRWASLQLEVLCTLKLDKDIRARLGKLPPKLEQLYLEVYNELSSYRGDGGRSMIDNTLKWLLYAQRTLYADEFLWAVAVNLDIAFEEITREDVLDLCRNLVIYDEGLDVFRFAHLSVREFLETRSEFSQIACDTFAGESCLLQVIASSDCSTQGLSRNDERLVCLCKDSALNEESAAATAFLAYANHEWIHHCSAVSGNISSNDTSLARLLKTFLDGHLGLRSALNAWVQWYCSRILEEGASIASWQLQTLLTSDQSPLSRSFFIAIICGFGDIVAARVQDPALSDEEKSKGLELAAMAAMSEIFDIIMSNGDLEVTEPILFHVVKNADVERFKLLLDSGGKVGLTKRIIVAACESQSYEKMALLLGRYPEIDITLEVLRAAVVGMNQDAFELLLAQVPDNALTKEIVYQAVTEYQADKLISLLERVGGPWLYPGLLEKATKYNSKSTEILKIILERGGAAQITKRAMTDICRWDVSVEALLILLDHGAQVTQDLLVAVVSKRISPDILHVLLEHGCQVDRQVLRLAPSNPIGARCLTIMLDHADDALVAEEMTEMLIQAAGSYLSGPGMVERLLDKAGDVEIPEDALFAAALNSGSGSDVMRIFLDHSRTPNITEEMLRCATSTLDVNVVLELLDHVDVSTDLHELLEAAAVNITSGGELMKILLKQVDLEEIPEALFNYGIRNDREGLEIIQALEEVFGPIAVNADSMAKIVRQALGKKLLPPGAAYLFDPALITEVVLLDVMSLEYPRYHDPHGDETDDFRYELAENAMHLPVSIDVLKAAARNCDLDCFRFLWNRGYMVKVPEDLMAEAAKNGSFSSSDVFEFLLDQGQEVEIGEEVMLAIVGNIRIFASLRMFDMVLERGFAPRITHSVMKKAIQRRNNDSWPDDHHFDLCLHHFRRQGHTEDLFKVAAINGKESILYKLSRFYNMDSPAKKWLDLAQLYKAAAHNDIDTLKECLRRVAEPEAALYFATPIEEALLSGHTLVIQMMLAAGMPPDVSLRWTWGYEGVTPLWWAADQGHLEMVKVLLNAGASLEFKNNMGYSPSMIAKRKGHARTFRFLVQAEKEQQAQRDVSTAESS